MMSPVRRYSILLCYFLFICFLFFLPGKAFPQAGNWMGAIHFDKWVHLGIFALLTYITCWTVNVKNFKFFVLVCMVAAAYGLIVEFIQDHFIPNRSLDLGDWAADIAGSLAGIWCWSAWQGKK